MKEMISLDDVMGIVLAGGKGERLYPLTAERAKPAVPIAGSLRIIDFVLNNFVKSGIRRVNILTQTKQDSLNRHVLDFWNLYNMTGEHITLVPAQMRTGTDWYKGTADAVYQNMHLIENEKPKKVAIFGGDHVYYMNINQAVQYHNSNKSDATIMAKKILKSECPREKDGRLSYGIIEIDKDNNVTGFKEKPMPEEVKEEEFYVSMGNYIFETIVLKESLKKNPDDFGKHVLPKLVKEGKKVMIYNFSDNYVPGMEEHHEKGYWEDVGNIDSYFKANMDLVSIVPKLNLYNKNWALWTSKHFKNYSPTKTVFAEGIDEAFLDNLERSSTRRGTTYNSLISLGGIISGHTLNSVLGAGVRIHSYARAIDSIIFDDVDIGRHSKIKNTIIDKNVNIPPGTIIGYDKEHDLARGFTVSEGGITVVPKGHKF